MRGVLIALICAASVAVSGCEAREAQFRGKSAKYRGDLRHNTSTAKS